MSDEEKEAIEILKLYFGDNPTLNITKYVNIVLNLIEKQSKEIEELKVNNKKLQDKCKELIFEKQELTSALLDSTPNDRIKAKIKELENKLEYETNGWESEYEYCKEVLQSLLEKE
jgi:hypothetical protein